MSTDHSRIYVDVVIDGEDRTFDLTETTTLSIGRSPQCTVVLDEDSMVSRKHALIQHEESGEYYLSDLGSRNGTTRNGVPVTSPVLLADGDSFTIGSHRFVFHRPLAIPRVEAFQAPTAVMVVERMITTLVVDLRDYTGLARELGESRISELMNALFHRSGELLKRNGSWAQKYIGDAVMALWVHEDDVGTPPEMALIFQSLVEFAKVVETLTEEFALPRPLRFGAGINTGMAVTGNMGSAAVADHTALGDSVNKAFRLEAATKEVGREIVLGWTTRALISIPDDVADAFAKHSLLLKGYDEPEDLHALALADLTRVAEAVRS